MTVLVLVRDLFFHGKIAAVAKSAGVDAAFCGSADALLERAKQSPLAEPSLILVDLDPMNRDALPAIQRLRQSDWAEPASSAEAARPRPRIIGFLSHVQTERKREAEIAGCDLVLPRSVFFQNLADLLRQSSCYETPSDCGS